LLLEEDDDTRPLFKELLTNKGYKVIMTIDEADALQRVNDPPVAADFVLVDVVGKSIDTALQIGNKIRQAGELQAPLIVIAAKYDEELGGTTAQVGENQYIVYLEDGNELFDLLAGLSKSEEQNFQSSLKEEQPCI
jgi:DNA-binding response OmpR family regulator